MDISAAEPRSRAVGHDVSSVAFTFYTAEEVRQMSVQEITLPITYSELGRPLDGSLYDPKLGTTTQNARCETCSLGYQECPGHFGHIELAVPLLNPFVFPVAFKLLRGKCWYCNRFRLPSSLCRSYLAKLRALDAGEFELADELNAYLDDSGGKVPSSDEVNNRLHSERQDRRTALIDTCAKAWQATQLERKTGTVRRGPSWTRTIDAFLKANVDKGKCANCGAIPISLRRDKQMKVFRDLSKKSQEKNRASGHRLQSLSGAALKIDSPEDGTNANGNDQESLGGEHKLGSQRVVLSMELEHQLKALWAQENELCDLMFGGVGRPGRAMSKTKLGHEIFFVKVLAVPPSRFRPPAKGEEGEMPREHPQNFFLSKMLTHNSQLRTAADTNTPGAKSIMNKVRTSLDLQEAFNSLLDSTYPAQGTLGGSVPTGIKQQLEHKEGLFRMHMMGKRVNYSARSVIGPDPFLETCEIGIPQSFAQKLTIAEPVNPLNIERLREAVIRGPNGYPGACFVEEANTGLPMRLHPDRERQRRAQAMLLDKTFRSASSRVAGDLKSEGEKKRVYRHLRTGDIVLFNRQPSLHRASIMAHRVKVLPGERTFRMHYANCGAYNADFDGDEMNVHLPQDEVARAEAEHLLLADRHYITPTSGEPLRGLIQDHVVAGVVLTKRDTFLDRTTFQQLFYDACERSLTDGSQIKTPTPAILRPNELWTGKQLISLVLDTLRTGPPMTLYSKSRTKAEVVGDEESKIIILSGSLLQGVLDKKQFGSAEHGLVHAFYECYGAEAAGKLLSTFGRLFTLFIRRYSHTTGVGDLLLSAEAEQLRSGILEDCRRFAGRRVAAKLTADGMGKNEELPLPTSIEARELVAQVISSAKDREGETRLDSAMKAVLSGSSTKVMDFCFPHGLIKGFPENGFQLMTSTGAKGSTVNATQISCQLGQTELEGQRVPRNAAGATLPCFAPYESSARSGGYISDRFLTGIKPPEYFLHCMAGREGLVDTAVKTARSGYLQRCLVKHLEGVTLKYDHTVRDSDETILQFAYGGDGIDPCRTGWLYSQFDWQTQNIAALSVEIPVTSGSLLEKPREISGTVQDTIGPGAPVQFGAMSEKFRSDVEDYCKRNDAVHNAEELRRFFASRFVMSTAQPGEGVGVLAAQGIGEPSTQMTLNTFHFAGMGAAHVTLGIPRLRELLMTASITPKTPTMKMTLVEGVDKEKADSFARSLRKVTVRDLMESIAIRDLGSLDGIHREVYVTITFPDPSIYETTLSLAFYDVLTACLTTLTKKTKAAITRQARKLSTVAVDPMARKSSAITDASDVIESGSKKRKRGSALAEDDASSSDGGNSQAADEQDAAAGGSVDGYDDDSEEETDGEHEGDRSKAMDDESDSEKDDKADSSIKSATLGIKQLLRSFNRDRSGASIQVDKKHQKVSIPILVPLFAWGRLMLPELVLKEAEQSVVREVLGISRCFIEEDHKTGEPYLQTEGRNFGAAWGYGEVVDVNRIESNDIYGVLITYGVEAARAALENELQFVFDAYGIGVDRRHIAIIAENMMLFGGYRAFNRFSMDSAPSDFQKMSFETTVAFLTDAALKAQSDTMSGPSSQICVGGMAKGGTGSFGLLQRLGVQ